MALRPPSLNARCISKMVSLFSALRAASGDPPGFPEYPGANLPLMRPLMTWGTVSRLGLACIVFPGSEIEAYLIPESASERIQCSTGGVAAAISRSDKRPVTRHPLLRVTQMQASPIRSDRRAARRQPPLDLAGDPCRGSHMQRAPRLGTPATLA